MDLATSLVIVFLAFCLIMGAVLMYCIRERRMIDGLDGEVTPPQSAEAMESEDNRIVVVLFGAIIMGALLALITGYLVFFRTWG
jgi:heme/copper-type cytochrome/quinol oxidase subunit 2